MSWLFDWLILWSASFVNALAALEPVALAFGAHVREARLPIMIKVFLVLLLGLSCEAVGFAFLSRGLREVSAPEAINVGALLRLVRSAGTNGSIWLGLLFQAAFFATILILIARKDVSFVLPLTALGMVFTTLAARFILHEHVSPIRWTGILLIVLGSTFVTYSEQVRRNTLPGGSGARAGEAGQAAGESAAAR